MKIVAYLQGVIAELRKVVWPTPATVIRNFVAVVVGLGLATLLVGALDYGFITLLGIIIK